MRYLLAIDQGTTSSRAILFDIEGRLRQQHQLELTQSFPESGWVEQDPQEIWRNTLLCCQAVIKAQGISAKQVIALGISNQRETAIIWNKKTGAPIYPAIVWQDRRSADFCQDPDNTQLCDLVAKKTGLLLDPYFSATKIQWILDQMPGARILAEKGDLLFGTVDSFLLWHLTKGKVHATDATNASRTLLFNIHQQRWDAELLNHFRIPFSMLPEVYDSAFFFGEVDAEFLGAEIPITGIAGDQQAASFGQALFSPGEIKGTYGTGCFMVMNTGKKIVQSKHALLSTVLYRLNGEVTYGLEGSIFSAGSTIQWLRDGLQIIQDPAECERLASSIESTQGVYLVPAFTGLGAPYWDSNARGAILGLTRRTGVKEIVRAALEAVCYQTKDLMEALREDSGFPFSVLKVDGGMASNNWLLQFLSDMIDVKVERPKVIETTALGAAALAGFGVGCFESLETVRSIWHQDQVFQSNLSEEKRMEFYKGWRKAVERVGLQ